MPSCEIEPQRQVVRNLFLLKPVRLILKTKTKTKTSRGGSRERCARSLRRARVWGPGRAPPQGAGSAAILRSRAPGDAGAPYMAAVFTRPQPISAGRAQPRDAPRGQAQPFPCLKKKKKEEGENQLATSIEHFTLLCMPNVPAECV